MRGRKRECGQRWCLNGCFFQEVTALVSDDYEIACEHAHSCAVMIANKQKFKKGDDWYTVRIFIL